MRMCGPCCEADSTAFFKVLGPAACNVLSSVIAPLIMNPVFPVARGMISTVFLVPIAPGPLIFGLALRSF